MMAKTNGESPNGSTMAMSLRVPSISPVLFATGVPRRQRGGNAVAVGLSEHDSDHRAAVPGETIDAMPSRAPRSMR